MNRARLDCCCEVFLVWIEHQNNIFLGWVYTHPDSGNSGAIHSRRQCSLMVRPEFAKLIIAVQICSLPKKNLPESACYSSCDRCTQIFILGSCVLILAHRFSSVVYHISCKNQKHLLYTTVARQQLRIHARA